MPETLVSIFWSKADRLADKPVLQVKRDNAYHDVTWRELAENVRSIASTLVGVRVQPGDRVAILAENSPEWIEADLAIMSVGAITVALHAPLTAAQVQEQIVDSQPEIAFYSTPEQLAKLQSIPFASRPRSIIAFDVLESRRSLPENARTEDQALTRELAARIAAVQPDDLCAICYTSGTTGESKGVMLTHDNLVSNIRACQQVFPTEPGEVTLLYLPLTHIYARMVDLYYSLASDRVIALAECIDALAQNLQEVRPHTISGVPRVHQKLAAAAKPLYESGDKDALRRILGGRIQYVGSGGAALPPEIARFYWDSGVPLYQGYGLTETSPVISFNTPDRSRIGTAGLPIPGVEVVIAEDGEILTRGPHVMKGYWRKPEATAEAIDQDGWFHTGDIGRLDEDGFLTITDRKKDLIVTAYGKNIAPQKLEGLLCSDPFIEQALVYGDAKPCLAALIIPVREELESWARDHGLDTSDYDRLLADSAVSALYSERIARALKDVSPSEQVKRFLLRAEPFSYARGELTLTAKLRRGQIMEGVRERMDSLYDE